MSAYEKILGLTEDFTLCKEAPKIVLRFRLLRMIEEGRCLALLPELSVPEKQAVVSNAPGLEQIVGDDDDGVVLFQRQQELLNGFGTLYI